MLPEFLKGVKLFGFDLQSFRTVIYCLLIIVVINFRTKGIMGESELNFAALKRIAKRRSSACSKGGKKK